MGNLGRDFLYDDRIIWKNQHQTYFTGPRFIMFIFIIRAIQNKIKDWQEYVSSLMLICPGIDEVHHHLLIYDHTGPVWLPYRARVIINEKVMSNQGIAALILRLILQQISNVFKLKADRPHSIIWACSYLHLSLYLR